MKFFSEGIAFAYKDDAPPLSFQPLADLPLLIMVGLTSVGKSTLVELLQGELEFQLLPTRRQITDEIIIVSLQVEDGQSPRPVRDRIRRFEYTARYRAKYPGGMAHALNRLVLAPSRLKSDLLFDGLRGLNELQYAETHFPRARYVFLDAPDLVRVRRILGRSDSFDSASLHTPLSGDDIRSGLMTIPRVESVFTQNELEEIAMIAQAAGQTVDDTTKKVSIVVEERQNYDSDLARDFLSRTLAPWQALLIDTSNQTPQSIAAQVTAWYNGV